MKKKVKLQVLTKTSQVLYTSGANVKILRYAQIYCDKLGLARYLYGVNGFSPVCVKSYGVCGGELGINVSSFDSPFRFLNSCKAIPGHNLVCM